MKFSDIPQFTRDSPYNVSQPIDSIEKWLIKGYVEDYGLDMCPDFQRGHVWTEAQQIAFVEYILQGGRSGRDIYLNHPQWMGTFKGPFVLVDGLQRLTALLRFVRDEIPAFGHRRGEFEDRMAFGHLELHVHINTLRTRAEVLKWYVEMNSGGTPHSQAEIDRVKAMWAEETARKKGAGP